MVRCIKRDRHMNLFEEYVHGEKMPLENNLTRALAIALEENYNLMKEFIKLISKKFDENIPCRKGKYSVGIQYDLDNVADFGELERVYGLTLATEKYEPEQSKNKEDDNKKITDIIISLGQRIIIIEAKRDATNPTNQLEEQLAKIWGKCIKTNNCKKESLIPTQRALDWEEIFNIVDKVYFSEDDKDDRIINDFSDFLYGNMSGCAPKKRLDQLQSLQGNPKIDSNFKEFVNARLTSIKKEYLEKYDPQKKLNYKRKIIPLELPYLIECDLEYDRDANCINTVMYIGSQTWQYWNFKETETSTEILNTKIIRFDSKRYSVEIRPYIKFYDNFGSQICMYEMKKIDIEMYHSIIGQFKKNEDNCWIRSKTNKNLMEEIRRIGKSNFANDIRFGIFKEQFDSETQNRKCVICTTQFCVRVKIPFNDACILDKEKKLPEFINRVIKKVSPN